MYGLRSLASLTLVTACGPVEEMVTVETRVRLHDRAAPTSSEHERALARRRDAFYTEDLIFVSPGEAARFESLELPAEFELEFELAVLPRLVEATEVRVHVAVHGADGTSSALEEPATLEHVDGQSTTRFSIPLSNAVPVTSLELTVHGVERSLRKKFLGLARTEAVYERELSLRSASDRPRQVLFVTLDTFRADHLAALGRVQLETPRLDELIEEATLFTRCYSTANVTRPSHATMFTGLYLKDHGLVSNNHVLGRTTPTIVEGLRERGIGTAAFLGASNFWSERTELSRRFESWFDCVPRDRRAEDVNSDAIPWITEHRNEDWFAWVHYFDTHAPYAPPYPWNLRYHDRSRFEVENQLSSAYDWHEIKSRDDGELMRSLYRAETTYVDDRLGRLLDRLRDLRRFRDALVIVVGDHGEGLGEFGFRALHSGLSDATTHVPLVIKPPGSSPGRRVDELVSTVDLTATLCDYFDMEIPPGGRSVSLRPLVQGSASGGRERVFSEHAHGLEVSVRTEHWRANLGLVDHSFGGSADYEIRAGELRLFDLREMPTSERDAARRHPRIAADLEAALREFVADAMGLSASETEDPEFLENLEALGY